MLVLRHPVLSSLDSEPWSLLPLSSESSWSALATVLLSQTPCPSVELSGLHYLESLQECPPHAIPHSDSALGFGPIFPAFLADPSFAMHRHLAHVSLAAAVQDTPESDRPWDTTNYVIPPTFAFLSLSPSELLHTAPASVADARRRPDYKTPGGWEPAIRKEINRVELFGAWVIRPFSSFRKDLILYGSDRCSMCYIFTALTVKTTADGDLRDLDVANKFRVTPSRPTLAVGTTPPIAFSPLPLTSLVRNRRL